jgi:hypothetical protein
VDVQAHRQKVWASSPMGRGAPPPWARLSRALERFVMTLRSRLALTACALLATFAIIPDAAHARGVSAAQQQYEDGQGRGPDPQAAPQPAPAPPQPNQSGPGYVAPPEPPRAPWHNQNQPGPGHGHGKGDPQQGPGYVPPPQPPQAPWHNNTQPRHGNGHGNPQQGPGYAPPPPPPPGAGPHHYRDRDDRRRWERERRRQHPYHRPYAHPYPYPGTPYPAAPYYPYGYDPYANDRGPNTHPYPPSYGRGVIVCASRDYRTSWCQIPAGARVQLVRRISSSSCNFGQDWGVSPSAIWVANGCRAEFAVY